MLDTHGLKRSFNPCVLESMFPLKHNKSESMLLRYNYEIV